MSAETTGRVHDAVEIAPNNIRQVWEFYRDQITSQDLQLSIGRAGELAAARIRIAIGSRLQEIDQKARQIDIGLSQATLTDEEIAWYELIEVQDWNPYADLIQISGTRTLLADLDDPRAQLPLFVKG